jgi:peptidoglycan/xylan/chitin deacetylase (PgdA/CDA1 family)
LKTGVASFLLIVLSTGTVLTLSSCVSTGKKGKKTPGIEDPASIPGPPPLPTSVGTQDSYSKVNTTRPCLALTFDDGPHATNTPRLLDLLKARNVKATFFVVATNAKRYPEIMRRIVAEGHEIGNHTVTHTALTKMSDSAIRQELTSSHEAIQSITGVAPRTMRPPYGAITATQKSWIRRDFGYPAILWSVDPEDWKKPGPSVVTSRLVSGAKPGGILLVHDIHSASIDAMPSTIDQLLAKGFQFVTVTQLIAMDGK